jgi:hypothetical protein
MGNASPQSRLRLRHGFGIALVLVLFLGAYVGAYFMVSTVDTLANPAGGTMEMRLFTNRATASFFMPLVLIEEAMAGRSVGITPVL